VTQSLPTEKFPPVSNRTSYLKVCFNLDPFYLERFYLWAIFTGSVITREHPESTVPSLNEKRWE